MTNLKQSEMAESIGRCRESIAKIELNRQEMGLTKFLEMLKNNDLNIVIYKENDNA